MKRIKNISGVCAMILLSVFTVGKAAAQRREMGAGHGVIRTPMSSGAQNTPHFNQPSASQPVHQAPTMIRPNNNFPSAGNQTRTEQHHYPLNNFPQHQTPAQAPVVHNTPHSNFIPAPRQNNFHPQSAPSTARRGYGYGNGGYSNTGYRHDYRPVNRFYYSGAYHPHPYYYRPFTPRFGIRINILPTGYYPFYFGSNRYFYDDGLFYSPYDGYYETILPPLGAYVPSIPSAAYPILINGADYYEYQGTYYQRVYSAPGNYQVVGVNGLLKQDLPVNDAGDIISDESIQSSPSAPLPLTVLPQNFKTVTLNNITYYVSPSGEYYTKDVDENNKVTYQVAALEAPPVNN